MTLDPDEPLDQVILPRSFNLGGNLIAEINGFDNATNQDDA